MIYIKAFVKIYNCRYKKLVHERYEIVQIEKYPILRVEKLLNLDSQRFFKISKVSQSAHIVLKDSKGNISYLYHYIDQDQLNEFYD